MSRGTRPAALPAEAVRWLAADLGEDPVRVVVAGVTGGSGATTLAALLARTLAAHRPTLRSRPAVSVLDHDGGTLHERCGAPAPSRGDGAEPADVVVQCVGARALTPQVAALDDPWSLAVVVVPWSTDGLRLGKRAVERLGGDRTVVVPVDVTRTRPRLEVLGLPWDRVLTAPGLVRDDAVSPTTGSALMAITVEVLAAARHLELTRVRG